ncbi:NDP-sugar synthase [bacterium]|nr:NDP-sugar synthase [bacterium]
MKALIYIDSRAGGLFPLAKDVSRALLPVCDRELLHYQIMQVARAGISQIVLAAGFRVDQLRDFIRYYSGGLEFGFVLEQDHWADGGALCAAREMLDGDSAAVIDGGVLSDIDLAAARAAHERSGRPATIVTVGTEDPAGRGLIKTRDGTVLELTGSDEAGPGPHRINAGICLLEPQAYQDLPEDPELSLEAGLLPRLIAEHTELTHHAHEGLWVDTAGLEDYLQANFALLARRYTGTDDWLWGERRDCAVFKDLVYLSKQLVLGKGVDLFHRVILMRDVRVGDGCRLQNCLVLPEARIGSGCDLQNCIVGPGVEVGDDQQVANKVLVRGEDDTPFFPTVQALTY